MSARQLNKLSAVAVKQATADPNGKTRKLADGGGLYLEINPSGAKYWRYKYRYAGKEKRMAFGVYPEVDLASARRAHLDARKILSSGEDPNAAKRVAKLTRNIANDDTFGSIAKEWAKQHLENKSEGHTKRARRMLEKDLLPYFGRVPISEIKAAEILAALHRIQERGAIDTAHRARQMAGMIFRYGVATGRCERDITSDLQGALKPRTTKHRPALTSPEDVGPFLIAIDGYQSGIVVKAALQLSALLFQRPGEMRKMEWSEINWADVRWELPAGKMKMGAPHIVPLPIQAVEILTELYAITGSGKYVFPSARGRSRPLSDNGVRTAMRTMGYDNDTMCPHGFRAMARTLLDEVLRFPFDIIEAQLSHTVRDATGRAYNRTTKIEERTAMMQKWADYLDKLRTEAAAEASRSQTAKK